MQHDEQRGGHGLAGVVDRVRHVHRVTGGFARLQLAAFCTGSHLERAAEQAQVLARAGLMRLGFEAAPGLHRQLVPLELAGQLDRPEDAQLAFAVGALQ